MHTFIQIGNTWFHTDNGWLDPDAEPTDPGSRKLAVVPSLAGTSVGMSLLPRAMPTMAVMWVSGPNTNRGIERFCPTLKLKLRLFCSVCHTNHLSHDS